MPAEQIKVQHRCNACDYHREYTMLREEDKPPRYPTSVAGVIGFPYCPVCNEKGRDSLDGRSHHMIPLGVCMCCGHLSQDIPEGFRLHQQEHTVSFGLEYTYCNTFTEGDSNPVAAYGGEICSRCIPKVHEAIAKVLPGWAQGRNRRGGLLWERRIE